jgi:hypothetical protein
VLLQTTVLLGKCVTAVLPVTPPEKQAKMTKELFTK